MKLRRPSLTSHQSILLQQIAYTVAFAAFAYIEIFPLNALCAIASLICAYFAAWSLIEGK